MRFTTGDEVTCSEEHSILDVYEFKETYVLITEGGGREGGYATGNQELLGDPGTHPNSTSCRHHTVVVMVPRSIRKRESLFTCFLYNWK